MTRTPLAILSLAALAPAPARAGGDVAVICLGQDVAAVGELQRTLDDLLAGRVRPTAEVAAELADGAGVAGDVSAASRAEADELLAEGTDLYYRDRVAPALARFDALAGLHVKDPHFPALDRIRLRLWLGASHLALGAAADAEKQVLAALSIDPALVVDPKEFPPRLVEVAQRVRGRLRTARLTVQGLPPGAQVRVDGRTVTSPAVVAIGRREILLLAPGYKERVLSIDLASDATVSPALAIALPAELETPLQATVIGSAAVPPALVALGKRLHVSRLAVIVHTGAGPQGLRAAFFSSLSRMPEVAPATGTAAVEAEWIVPRLKGARPTASILASASIGPAARVRAVRAGGTAADTGFQGVAARAGAGAEVGAWTVDAVADLRHYPSSLEVRRPDGSRQQVQGGRTWGVSLRGAHLWGSGSLRPHAGLAVLHEHHSAPDMSLDGEPMRLLTSQERTLFGASGGARLLLRRARLRAEVTVAPVVLWKESPSGATGKSPLGGPDAAWLLEAEWALSKGLAATAAYEGERRSVRFRGEGSALVSPAYRDATMTETLHGVAFGARWRW